MKKQGFLLIEFLFVVLLIGVTIAATSLPGAADRLILKEEGMLMATDLRWLRQYSLNIARGHRFVPAAGFAPIPEFRISRTLPGYLVSSSIKILRLHVFPDKVNVAGTISPIYFSADGGPNRPLTILLLREKEEVRIVIDRVGRIRME